MPLLERVHEGVLDQLADDLTLDLASVVALENVARHLAGTESLDACALRQAAVGGIDLRLDFRRGNGDAELLLDRAQVFDGDVHDVFLTQSVLP